MTESVGIVDTAQPASGLTPAQVDRAIRFTYAQMMLNAVFGASTGGMFLIGFAMQLGANDVLLGLLSTVPQVAVLFQLLPAYLIERGVSRKTITVRASFVTPLCWFLIAAIPFLAHRLDTLGRLGILMGVMALVMLAGQFVGNARGSWIGELIPESRRGRFFGNCTLFAGIVGAVFAIGEGRFLDYIQSRGLMAFTALFFFGALFGIASAFLNLPQPDCPLPRRDTRPPFLHVLRDTFKNRPLCILAVAHAVLAMTAIAGPFYSAYCLRDLGMSYFGLGCVNAVSTAAVLSASPLAGKFVDRYGGRPLLIIGLLIMAPTGLAWCFIPPGRADLAYRIMPFTSAIGGLGAATLGVAFSTMAYKMTTATTRAAQFAMYGLFVTLAGAPMPFLGGWMIHRLQAAGYAVDLRLTFYIWIVLMLLAAFAARFIREPGSTSTRHLVFCRLPRWVGSLYSSPADVVARNMPTPDGVTESDAEAGPKPD